MCVSTTKSTSFDRDRISSDIFDHIRLLMMVIGAVWLNHVGISSIETQDVAFFLFDLFAPSEKFCEAKFGRTFGKCFCNFDCIACRVGRGRDMQRPRDGTPSIA